MSHSQGHSHWPCSQLWQSRQVRSSVEHQQNAELGHDLTNVLFVINGIMNILWIRTWTGKASIASQGINALNVSGKNELFSCKNTCPKRYCTHEGNLKYSLAMLLSIILMDYIYHDSTNLLVSLPGWQGRWRGLCLGRLSACTGCTDPGFHCFQSPRDCSSQAKISVLWW